MNGPDENESRQNVNVVLLHGVGPFDPSRVCEQVKGLLQPFERDAKITIEAVSWRLPKYAVEQGSAIQLKTVADIGSAALAAACDASITRAKWTAPVLSLLLSSATTLGIVAVPAVGISLIVRVFQPQGWLSWYTQWLVALWIVFLFMAAAVGVLQPIRIGTVLRATLLPIFWPLLFAITVAPIALSRYLMKREHRGVAGPALLALALGSCMGALQASKLNLAVAAAVLVVAATGIAVWAGRDDTAIAVATWLERNWSIWGVMVASDLLRYLGDSAYREAVHSAVATVLMKDSAESQRTVLVAHSLGSVIALDFIARHVGGLRDRPLLLVTMGSPLRRWLSLFFPARYSAPELMRERLISELPHFEWINVYRVGDIIGTRIFGRNSHTDIASGGRWTWWPPLIGQHTGYWTDASVRDRIADAYVPFADRPIKHVPAGTVSSDAPTTAKRLRYVLPSGLRWIVATCAGTAGAVFGNVDIARSFAAEYMQGFTPAVVMLVLWAAFVHSYWTLLGVRSRDLFTWRQVRP